MLSRRKAAMAVIVLLGLSGLGSLAGQASGTQAVTITTTPSPISDNLNQGDQTFPDPAPLLVQNTSAGTTSVYTGGWNLTITSTLFTDSAAKTLPASSLKITTVTSTCESSCSNNPTNTITWPVTVPAAATAPTAVKFYNAAAGSGEGTYTVTPTLSLTIPQNSFAGTYTSTITVSMVSGP